MADSWRCRDYKTGDEHKILALFSKVFDREMSLQIWKWRFVESPFGKGIIKLLFDCEELIGHYAVVPMIVKVADQVVNAVFSMTTMTHPDYRGYGILGTLAEETYREVLRKGSAFVYGFPNSNSYHGFTERLGWNGFGNMTIWQKDILEEDIRDLPINDNVRQISQFENDITLLWEKVKQNYLVIVPRKKHFLNWRFVQNPEADYDKCVYVDDEGEILGYVVLKIYRSESELKGHIVDMLSINEIKVVKDLLRYAYTFFMAEMAENISCFCSDNYLWADVLKEEGFVKRKMEQTYFGVRILGKSDESLGIVEHFPAWYLTMGDSDVF